MKKFTGSYFKNINKKQMMKDYGKNFASNRLSQVGQGEEDEEDNRSGVRKTYDSAKDTGKEMVKDVAKDVAKEAVKEGAKKLGVELSKKAIVSGAKAAASSVGGALSSALGWIVGAGAPVIGALILIVLFIFILCQGYVMFLGHMDEFQDGALKFSANAKLAFSDWAYGSDESKEDENELSANADAYETYLAKRFMMLHKKTIKGDLTDGEADDLKTSAVTWVYTRIYMDYFEASPDAFIAGLFANNGNPNSLAPTFKPAQEVANEFYVPKLSDNVYTARKKSMGDEINVYDIQSFDYVAGTLFDLLDLDLAVMRDRFISEKKDEIDEQIKVKHLGTYKTYAGIILADYHNFIGSVIGRPSINKPSSTPSGENNSEHSESIGIYKILSDFNLPTENFFKLDKYLHQRLLKFVDTTYSYSSSNDYKTFYNALNKFKFNKHDYDYDGNQEVSYQATLLAADIIKSESDYYTLVRVGTELQSVMKAYAMSCSTDLNVSSQIGVKTQALIDAEKLNEKLSKHDKALEERKQKEIAEVTIEVIAPDMEALLTKNIKDLNLVRTQQAALAYKDYLLMDEKITSIEYHSLNYDTLPEFNLPEYSFSAILNASKRWYKKELKKNIWDKDDYKNSVYLNDKVRFDGDGAPIIFAIDTKTNANYFSGNLKKYVSGMQEIISNAKSELQTYNDIFTSLLNNDTSKLKERESELWAMLEEPCNRFLNNGFVKEASTTLTDFNLGAFRSDLNNKTFNSELFATLAGGNYEIHALEINESTKVVSKVKGDTGLQSVIERYVYNCHGGGYATDGDATSFQACNVCLDEFINYNKSILEINESGSMAYACSTGDTSSSALKKHINEALRIINEEVKRLNEYESFYSEKLENATLDSGYFKHSNIKGIVDKKSLMKYMPNDYTIDVLKYKYTQEEAVKLVAKKHYPEVLQRFKSAGGGSIGTPVFIGDLEIGTQSELTRNAVMNATYYPKIVEYSELFGLDPHFVAAMIYTESGGNPNAEGGGAYGLAQIQMGGSHDWSTSPLVATDIDGVTHTISNITIEKACEPDFAIKFACMYLRQRADYHGQNLFMGVAAYNMGSGNLNGVIRATVEQKLGKSPATVEEIEEYEKSLDLGWISYMQEHYTGIGTKDHILKVLRYYDTSNGYPYIVDRDTKEKIYMVQDENPDISVSDDENNPYHNNGRLVLWKQYYTENNVFKNADVWAKENQGPVATDTRPYSVIVKDTINEVVASLSNDISAISINSTELEALIAGTLNAGVFKPSDAGDKYKNIDVKPGFKIMKPNKYSLKTVVTSLANDYIKLYENLDGKDRDFAVYLYVTENPELAKIEISAETGTFADYVKRISSSTSESYEKVDEDFIIVAQILSGNLNVNIEGFYNLTEDSTDDESVTPEEVVNPADKYFEEWILAKYTMHESYNSMTEELRAEKPDKYPALPTYKEYLDTKKSDTVKGNDILVITTSTGKIYTVELNERFLDNINALSSLGSVSNIVIHDTGENGQSGSAPSMFDIMNKPDSKETMHYVVGSNIIYNYVPTNKVAKHLYDFNESSGGTATTVKPTNSLGIQFEVNPSRNKEHVFWNTVGITKYLLEKNHIYSDDIEKLKQTVVLHNNVTGANDSKYMLTEKGKFGWDSFIKALQTTKVELLTNTGDLPNDTALKIVATAKSFIGKGKYELGGNGPETFDASGLIHYSYTTNGVDIPRTIDKQVQFGKDILNKGEKLDLKTLYPGDLLFSGGTFEQPTHVAMYIGTNKTTKKSEYVYISPDKKLVSVGTDFSNVIRVKRVLSTIGKFEMYSQKDPRWRYEPYCDNVIGTDGCGTTSTAIAISGFNVKIPSSLDTNGDGKFTPDESAVASTNWGTVVKGVGTSHDYFTKAANAVGLKCQSVSGLDGVKKALKEGKAVIGCYSSGVYSYGGGHIIAFVGLSSDNKIIVVDPNLEPGVKSDWTGTRYHGPNPDSNLVGGTFFAIGP